MSNAEIRIPKEKSRSMRSRAVSLSIDWDNVVTGSLSRGVRKISRSKEDSMDELVFWQPGSVQVERSTVEFPTGSSYAGRWDSLGIAGFGYYTFPHEVEYEGNLRDGMFHGEGTLTYPMGQKLDGEWVRGRMVSFKFRFANGLEYDSPWKYCRMPDRRYYTSIQEGLHPAGRSLLTNNSPPRKIPDGCYDTGDGFYNPATKCVMSAYTPGKILRKWNVRKSIMENMYSNHHHHTDTAGHMPPVPTKAQEKWIMENCRKAWDEPTGYRPDLYEHWVTGRSTDSVFTSSDDQRKTTFNSVSSLDEGIKIIVPSIDRTSSGSSYNNWWEQSPSPNMT